MPRRGSLVKRPGSEHSAEQVVGELGGGQVAHAGKRASVGQALRRLPARAGGVEYRHRSAELGLLGLCLVRRCRASRDWPRLKARRPGRRPASACAPLDDRAQRVRRVLGQLERQFQLRDHRGLDRPRLRVLDLRQVELLRHPLRQRQLISVDQHRLRRPAATPALLLAQQRPVIRESSTNPSFHGCGRRPPGSAGSTRTPSRSGRYPPRRAADRPSGGVGRVRRAMRRSGPTTHAALLRRQGRAGFGQRRGQWTQDARYGAQDDSEAPGTSRTQSARRPAGTVRRS